MSGLAGAAWRMMLLRRVHPSSGMLPEFWYFCLRPAQQCCTSLGQVFLLCRQGGAAEGQERCWGWLCRDGKALKRLGSLSFPCLVGVFVFPVPAVLPRDKMSLKGFPGYSPCPASGQNPNFSCPSAVLLHKVMLREAKQPLLRFASP